LTRPTEKQDNGIKLAASKPQLDWSYLAGVFDTSGSVYEKRTQGGLGLGARLRFSGYDRLFLEEVRSLTGGSISTEHRAKGPYYRLTITGYFRVETVLMRLLPDLRRKKRKVDYWLTLHKAKIEIARLQRRLHLKRRKYVKRELRQIERALRQIPLPPPRVTD